mmetsp:Transcript_1912/g.11776  ORF Transcript_1912/g.11776 Transcript_1912/m.11776 type:complete len:460 (+) Transcript_1912:2410-3789(+)
MACCTNGGTQIATAAMGGCTWRSLRTRYKHGRYVRARADPSTAFPAAAAEEQIASDVHPAGHPTVADLRFRRVDVRATAALLRPKIAIVKVHPRSDGRYPSGNKFGDVRGKRASLEACICPFVHRDRPAVPRCVVAREGAVSKRDTACIEQIDGPTVSTVQYTQIRCVVAERARVEQRSRLEDTHRPTEIRLVLVENAAYERCATTVHGNRTPVQGRVLEEEAIDENDPASSDAYGASPITTVRRPSHHGKVLELQQSRFHDLKDVSLLQSVQRTTLSFAAVSDDGHGLVDLGQRAAIELDAFRQDDVGGIAHQSVGQRSAVLGLYEDGLSFLEQVRSRKFQDWSVVFVRSIGGALAVLPFRFSTDGLHDIFAFDQQDGGVLCGCCSSQDVPPVVCPSQFAYRLADQWAFYGRLVGHRQDSRGFDHEPSLIIHTGPLGVCGLVHVGFGKVGGQQAAHFG